MNCEKCASPIGYDTMVCPHCGHMQSGQQNYINNQQYYDYPQYNQDNYNDQYPNRYGNYPQNNQGYYDNQYHQMNNGYHYNNDSQHNFLSYNAPTQNDSFICCPICGGRHLNLITDRDIAGAMLHGVASAAIGGVGMGMMAAGAGLAQQTFFVCQDCGERFRNPSELRKEIDKIKTPTLVMTIILIIFAMICLGFIFVDFTFMKIIGIVGCVMFLLFIIPFQVKLQKPKKELARIEDGMRRNRR